VPQRICFRWSTRNSVGSPPADHQILQVHDAVDLLALESPDLAHVVKLRFFAGLNHDEIGSLLGLNEKTIRRRWELARIRLFELIPSVS
jgi:DNA-directed RNA polymerase specialized sigma24 family protein